MASPYHKAVFAGVIFAATWSGSFVATKLALPLTSSIWLAAMRLLLAAVILFFWNPHQIIRLLKGMGRYEMAMLITSAIFTQAVYLGTTYIALKTISAALVSVLVASLPLVSIPIAVLFLNERTNFMEICATVLGILGVCVVIIGSGKLTGAAITASSILPMCLVMIAVICLGVGNALLKPLLAQYPKPPLVGAQMLFGALALVISAILIEGTPIFSPTSADIFGFIYLVLIGSIVCMAAWTITLNAFSSIVASGFFMLTPLFGIAFGYLFLGEILNPTQTIGGLMICSGILGRLLQKPRNYAPNSTP